MAPNKALEDLNPLSDSENESVSTQNRSQGSSSTKQLSDLDDDFDSDDEQDTVFQTKKKTQPSRFDAQDQEDVESEHSEDEENKDGQSSSVQHDEVTSVVEEQKKRARKLKKLTPEQLAKEQRDIKRTGVCYLSSIPPYMKPSKMRSVLSKFGKIDRLFMKPEDPIAYKKRVKYGGNKKKKHTEGWVEFKKKSDAKLCAQTMNGNIVGGKKSSYYHDDIINIKYLPGFKWFDLTQQISKENEIRQSKMALEISQQNKLDKSFVANVERSKRLERKRKLEGDKFEEPEAKRNFDQRDISSKRADAKAEFKKEKNSENLDSVLSKVF